MHEYKSKLPLDKVNKIVDRYLNEEVNTYELAKDFNCSSATIQRILTSKGIDSLSIGRQRKANYYRVDLSAFENNEFSDYWSGFIAADGCIYKNRVVIDLSTTDYDHLCKFGIGNPVTKQKTRESCRVDISSQELCDYLNDKYKITSNKTSSLEFPNLENYNHFVRGYFDGDGCIFTYEDYGLRGRIQIVGSELFLKGMQEVLPCDSYIRDLSNTEKVKVLKIGKKKDIELFSNFIYDDASILLERKKDKFNKLSRVEVL